MSCPFARLILLCVPAILLAELASATLACGPLLRPFVYRVTRNGQTSHLFGTMHAAVNLSDFPAEYRGLLDEASDLSVESRELTPRALAQMRADWFRRGQPRLSKQLSPRQWARYVRLLRANELPPEIADDLSPLGANMLISPWLKTLNESRHTETLDTQIARTFVDRPVRPLETLAGGHRVMVEAMDVQRLKTRLDSTTSGDTAQLVDAYRAGDEAATASLMDEARRESPRWYGLLMTERNARWLPKIRARMRRSPRHVTAVGTGHLFGDEGLIERLRRAKYDVERGP